MDIPNIYSQYSLPSLEGTSTHTFLTELITKDEEQNRDAGQYTTKEEEKWEVTALPLDWGNYIAFFWFSIRNVFKRLHLIF